MLARVDTLFASFAIGTVGLALLVYGRKQLRLSFVAVGLAMLIYPYFVPGLAPMLGLAVALLALLALLVKLGL